MDVASIAMLLVGSKDVVRKVRRSGSWKFSCENAVLYAEEFIAQTEDQPQSVKAMALDALPGAFYNAFHAPHTRERVIAGVVRTAEEAVDAIHEAMVVAGPSEVESTDPEGSSEADDSLNEPETPAETTTLTNAEFDAFRVEDLGIHESAITALTEGITPLVTVKEVLTYSQVRPLSDISGIGEVRASEVLAAIETLRARVA